MKKGVVTLLSLLPLLTLLMIAGCWDNRELDEYGYVQGVALDGGPAGKVRLTTHFYNPSSRMEMTGEAEGGHAGINIRTEGNTLFDAVRRIPPKFGRKAKWDHMRVILVGEKLIRSQNIGEIFDYLARDHEPRGTILPLVTKGEASGYLEIKPFIEQTVSQQYKKMEAEGARYSAKTSHIPLYRLALDLKSVTRVAVLPYIRRLDDDAVVSGTALLKKGRLSFILDEEATEAYLILTNQYQEGILEFPCTGNAAAADQVQRTESFETLSVDTRLTPRVHGDTVSVDVRIRIKGTIGELRCSKIQSIPDLNMFAAQIEQSVIDKVQSALAVLQRERLDAIGIGTMIYRKHPHLWKRWEPDWDKRFADCRFAISVKVDTLNTGMNVGSPFGKKKEK